MSLSLTPSRGTSFFPGFSRWSDIEREIDRDIARMNRMFNDTTNQFLPDKEDVHHRQPNYTYEENDQQADIEVELPGVAKENVTVDFRGDRLSISAKRYKLPLLPSATEIPVQSATQENGGTVDAGTSTKQTKDAEMTQDDEIKPEGTESKPEPELSVMYQLNIPIGNKFDVEKIAATMVGDGILTMVVPKKVEHAGVSRMIEIGSA